METAVVWPEGTGPFPAVIMYHHIGGLHESLLVLARRLASYGYCVFTPSLYWRVGSVVIDADNTDPVSLSMRGVVVKTTETPFQVMNDTRHLLNYIKHMRQVDNGPRGAVGYCLGGLFAIRASCVFPGEISAAASLYGVGLLDEGPESLEATLDRMTGAAYLAFAEHDRHVSAEDVARVRALFEKYRDTDWSVELLEGTRHGFAFPGRPMYDFDAAEHTWDKVLSMFDTRLGAGAGV
jgi:carboxymethylenebutenolidase